MNFDDHKPANRGAFRAYGDTGSVGVIVGAYRVTIGDNDTEHPLEMSFDEWEIFKRKIDTMVAERTARPAWRRT